MAKTKPVRTLDLTNAATDYVIALYTVDYLLNQEGTTSPTMSRKVASARKRIERLSRTKTAARRLLDYLSGFEDSLYRLTRVTEKTVADAQMRYALGLDEARWQSRLRGELSHYYPYDIWG